VGAGLYTHRQRYITIGVLVLLQLAAPLLSLSAQDRVLERHSFSEPEGRLLAFYSAAMAFTPAGLPPDDSRLAFMLEVSHVPSLSHEQRRPSIDKPESTNLAPFFPRPRVSVRVGGWTAEASWVPPMRVFDVEANLGAVSLAGPSVNVGSFRLSPRVWAVTGSVRGSMTCSTQEMIGRGPDLELYFNTVCYGRESDDWFEPRMLGGEAVAERTIKGTRAYALLGARVDRTRFNIGVITPEGFRDPDHPILELRTFRPHVAVGASWRVRREVSAGGELFYAPGSILTARVSGRWMARR
jgi:hypothetical protein